MQNAIYNLQEQLEKLQKNCNNFRNGEDMDGLPISGLLPSDVITKTRDKQSYNGNQFFRDLILEKDDIFDMNEEQDSDRQSLITSERSSRANREKRGSGKKRKTKDKKKGGNRREEVSNNNNQVENSRRPNLLAVQFHTNMNIQTIAGFYPDPKNPHRVWFNSTDNWLRHWQHATWVHNTRDTAFVLVAHRDVNITLDGIYYVYSQITYANDRTYNGHSIYVNDESKFACLHDTRVCSGCPRDQTPSFSCFTGGLIHLHIGDQIRIRMKFIPRVVDMSSTKTFFGLFKVG